MSSNVTFPLTGTDPNDPTPGTQRELRTNQGSSSGTGAARKAVIIGNKIASVGSTTVDGLGDALELPRLITKGYDEVVQRCGYRSELLQLYRDWTTLNQITDVYLMIVPPGTGSGTFTWTFATSADANGAVRVTYAGEDIYVPVVSGDAVATIATNVAAAINAKSEWLISASPALGVVTITSTVAGTRHDYALTQARAVFTVPEATTITKSAVTPSSTDDDFTNAINNLVGSGIYYHVNPKVTTAGATSTDNGIGEHAAMINTENDPNHGRACVMVFAMTGTGSQATTTATSVNSQWVLPIWAHSNDISNGQIATRFAAVLALTQASDKTPNLVDYGRNGGADGKVFNVPVPYTASNKPTSTEIKAALNNGYSVINWTPTGQSYIVDYVTSRSLTNSIQDYRCRGGHIPSGMHDFWDGANAIYQSEVQGRFSATPKQGEKRLQGFTYQDDVADMLKRAVDQKIDQAPAILDPAQRDYMKNSVKVGLLSNGFSSYVDIRIVPLTKKSQFLINETSPPR